MQVKPPCLQSNFVSPETGQCSTRIQPFREITNRDANQIPCFQGNLHSEGGRSLSEQSLRICLSPPPPAS